MLIAKGVMIGDAAIIHAQTISIMQAAMDMDLHVFFVAQGHCNSHSNLATNIVRTEVHLGCQWCYRKAYHNSAYNVLHS